MADIARITGVSKNTVSLALRGSSRVREDTRQRVEQAARKLGYRLNPTVAHLMAELRQNRTVGFQATLAMINAHETRDAFTTHPTIPIYVEGCRQRAKHLGYKLDEFWMHEPDMPVGRWQSIFRARNIRGLLIVGLMRGNRLPSRLAPLWEEFPTLVTGVRTRDPELSYTCSDHHTLALKAFEKAVELGYQRPALVLDRVIDELIEGRFTAGFLTGQSRLIPIRHRTRPFYDVEAARKEREVFTRWFKRNRPDVIFTLYHEVKRWVQDMGLRVPQDVGLIQYEWRADHGAWTGMDQRNDLVGATAVDMLVSMIHHNAHGVPDYPVATLIGSQWIEGGTTKG
ncbi:LacI family DNA-binding transcriptional regulator [Luteolibacter sp. LG18]|uniref:LacI family DNA-binding transcriptional regulator n=1 Tax=Luteolibacter sp. LG18 TaxID=2819286 RepID=UPI002B28C53A|nr:LacI family transcriptional regulator [Luteolibacter sp. LG18]